jgi:bifunctional non-homologous end joining protein LigD
MLYMSAPHYSPMLVAPVKPGESLPLGDDWGYEPKLDGHRMLAYAGLEKVRLYSRWDVEHTDKYPAVVEQLPTALQGRAAVLDGEMVGLDAQGRERFAELRRKWPRAIYFIFDILELDGKAVIRQSLLERRKLLTNLALQQNVQLVEMYDDRDALLIATRELGHEGVVAKDLRSTYKQGKRTRDWQKQKFHKQTGFDRPHPYIGIPLG